MREIFDLFDKEHTGHIEVKDLETIMDSLKREPTEVKEFIENLDPNAGGRITFNEFLNLMQQLENKIVRSGVQPALEGYEGAPGQHPGEMS